MAAHMGSLFCHTLPFQRGFVLGTTKESIAGRNVDKIKSAIWRRYFFEAKKLRPDASG